jgi:tRNA dimethylallyltransferase
VRVFVLAGPTGVGKTEVAGLLGRRLGLEVVSADSRQVYRGMDIGTAKPSAEERAAVPVHMLDLADPDAVVSAADYARAAAAAMRQLRAEGRRFIVAGGSGFYLRALFQPLFEAPAGSLDIRRRLAVLSPAALHDRLRKLDPARAQQLHPHDRQRVIRSLEVHELTGRTFTELATRARESAEFAPCYAVLSLPRGELCRRIDERFDRMMAAGLLAEVRALRERGLGSAAGVASAYGYAELLAFLGGRLSLEQAVRQAKQKTRAYARRQLTWFRSLPAARWFDAGDPAAAARQLEPLVAEVLADS